LILFAWLITVDHKIADMRRNIAAKMTRSVEITNVAVYRQMPTIRATAVAIVAIRIK